jgi:hypothetical protein
VTEDERTGAETPSPSEAVGRPASVEMGAEGARQAMARLSYRRRLTGVGAALQRAADALESVGVVDEAPSVSVTSDRTRAGSVFDALGLVESLSDEEWSERNDRVADELGVDEAMPDRPEPERVERVEAALLDLARADTRSDAEVHGPLDDAVDLAADLAAVRAEEHATLFDGVTAEGNPLEREAVAAERERAADLARLGVEAGERATDHVAAEGLTDVVAADLDGGEETSVEPGEPGRGA